MKLYEEFKLYEDLWTEEPDMSVDNLLTEEAQSLAAWNDQVSVLTSQINDLVKQNKDGSKVKLIKNKISEIVMLYKKLAKLSKNPSNISVDDDKEEPDKDIQCAICDRVYDKDEMLTKIKSGKLACAQCGEKTSQTYLNLPTEYKNMLKICNVCDSLNLKNVSKCSKCGEEGNFKDYK